MLLLGTKNVNAQSTYINSNNVEMDYGLYQELSEIYSKNYMEFITQDRYDELSKIDISEIEVIEYIEQPLIQLFAISHETDYKILRFIKYGNNVTLYLNWKKIPATRSYDVMAVRLENSTLREVVSCQQTYKLNNQVYNSNVSFKILTNGFGASFKLPEGNITELEEYIEFKYNGTGNGTIYGTYQHAQKSLTLAESRSYTISSIGLGKVLKFSNNTISDKFDKMTGIDIVA